MKSIFKIHPFYYMVALIAVLTGLFKDFLYISLIIFIHEVGHIIGALKYKWKIEKVVILPFGGVTIFRELINKSLKEEFVILVLGPLFQILFYFSLLYLNISNDLITRYHYSLLIFNLLPIIPLDGSKLINILSNKISSFKFSHILSIVVSLITVSLLLLMNLKKHNLIFLLIILFLIIKVIDEIKKHKYLFNKFLFERYNYDIKFNRIKKINSIDVKKMKKEYKHIFYKDRYYTEKEILNDIFNLKKH